MIDTLSAVLLLVFAFVVALSINNVRSRLERLERAERERAWREEGSE